MSVEEEVAYHSERAMRELDLGLVARPMAAARAHLGLSSLHLEKVRALQGPLSSVKPPLVMS